MRGKLEVEQGVLSRDGRRYKKGTPYTKYEYWVDGNYFLIADFGQRPFTQPTSVTKPEVTPRLHEVTADTIEELLEKIDAACEVS